MTSSRAANVHSGAHSSDSSKHRLGMNSCPACPYSSLSGYSLARHLAVHHGLGCASPGGQEDSESEQSSDDDDATGSYGGHRLLALATLAESAPGIEVPAPASGRRSSARSSAVRARALAAAKECLVMSQTEQLVAREARSRAQLRETLQAARHITETQESATKKKKMEKNTPMDLPFA